ADFELVRMRLVVRVLAANRAEAGTLGTAQDLLRNRERESVTRPRAEIELVVHDVLRTQLLRFARTRRLIFARVDLELEHGFVEAAKARAVKPRVEAQVEECARARLGDGELRRTLLPHGGVAVAPELPRYY